HGGRVQRDRWGSRQLVAGLPEESPRSIAGKGSSRGPNQRSSSRPSRSRLRRLLIARPSRASTYKTPTSRPTAPPTTIFSHRTGKTGDPGGLAVSTRSPTCLVWRVPRPRLLRNDSRERLLSLLLAIKPSRRSTSAAKAAIPWILPCV